MKKILVLLLLFSFSCNTEKANDCFQSSGKIIQQEVNVSSFDEIIVKRGVALILEQGPEFKVIIETGKNLINDVNVEVLSGRLELTDGNTCNLVRDYGLTKVYVTAPDIKKIRCSTQYLIRSKGILNYERLDLISEDFNDPDSNPLGDFRLQLNATTLTVVSNNLSSFYISGIVENLNVFFAAGNGRFEGGSLNAQNVNLRHRGSNDMVVNPQQKLTGRLVSTGNVISKNRPALVDVEVGYTGALIFE